MKNFKAISVALLATTLSFMSCGFGTTQGTTTGNNNNAALEAGVGVLGALLTGSNTTDATSSLLTGVIGSLLDNAQSGSIIGTWVYQEPAIQFESENLLAQAGGSLASSTMVNKLNPYFKAIGITKGKFSLTFNSDNTCSYTINGNTYNGTYVFDKSKKTVTISGTLFTFPTAYVSVSVNSMALTFDSTKLLTLTQGIGNAIPSATINTISSLSSSFKGMKTGFMFKKN